jgi:hypothetical protein
MGQRRQNGKSQGRLMKLDCSAPNRAGKKPRAKQKFAKASRR